MPDVLVGRDDGLVEVYGFDEMDEPVHRFQQVTRLFKLFAFGIMYIQFIHGSNVFSRVSKLPYYT